MFYANLEVIETLPLDKIESVPLRFLNRDESYAICRRLWRIGDEALKDFEQSGLVSDVEKYDKAQKLLFKHYPYAHF